MFSTSTVDTVSGSRLAGLIGESAGAGYHHQAIDRLADGLVVSAADGDGVIEAVEMPGDDFVVAVWHPGGDSRRRSIFAGLVAAARAFFRRESELVATTDVINPATEQVLRTLELAEVDAVDEVARAVRAQKAWACAPPAERAAALRSFAAVVDVATSASWPPSRWPMPDIRCRPRVEAGTSATCCSSTRPHRAVVGQADPGGRRSRCDPSTSRSASPG